MIKLIAATFGFFLSTSAFAVVYQCQAFEVDANGANQGIGAFSVDTTEEKLEWVSTGQDTVAACSGSAQQGSTDFVLGCGILEKVYDTSLLSDMNPLNPSNEDDYEWVSVSITPDSAGTLYQRTKVDGRILGYLCSAR